MKSAICIITCGRLEFTKKCIERYRQDNYPRQTVIIDNGSTDGTREWLAGLEREWSGLDVYYYDKNYGPHRARSHFMSMYRTRFPYLGCVSNDVFVDFDWVRAFEDLMDDVPQIGVVAPVDRDWGSADLVSGSHSYYAGRHIHWGDGYWLLRREVIEELAAKVRIRTDDGEVPHPGYFAFNSVEATQNHYWGHIRQIGRVTASHPTKRVSPVYSDAETHEWHRKYAILTKRVYCQNPRKYVEDTAGPIQYSFRGQRGSWADEPEWVGKTPNYLLDHPSSIRAQLDSGVSEDDTRMLSESDWNRLNVAAIWSAKPEPPKPILPMKTSSLVDIKQSLRTLTDIATIEQSHDELAEFVNLCLEHRVRTVLEVGSRFGGTLLTWLRLLPATHVITVDLPWENVTGNPSLKEAPQWADERRARWALWPTSEQRTFHHFENSHDAEAIGAVRAKLKEWNLNGVDMVFIDGDHCYAGVKQDYETYGPLASKLVAFNDFLHSPMLSKADCDVETLWAEVKACNRSKEIIYSDTYGIGVLFK